MGEKLLAFASSVTKRKLWRSKLFASAAWEH